jgi:16S rRNA (cytosine1402-N4)-methyltransferase
MSSRYHTPVLLQEAVESLACHPSGIYVDGTLGGGGHAFEILKRTGPDGKLVGIDADEEALAEAEKRLEPFGERKILVRSNFSYLSEVLAKLNINRVDGILLDLGISSHQLETPERGFSFALDAPLDMRMDRSSGMSAYDLINTLPEKDLKRIIRQYGEEQMSGRIARAIANRRRTEAIKTTGELAELIIRTMPPERKRGKIHPATKTFQAIRIAVNNELTNLEKALEDGIDLLATGGRFSIISFHSLEDRIVKDTFRSWEKGCICPTSIPFCICRRPSKLKVLTKKPIVPKDEEVERNPRARSAKLRVAERI